MNSRRVSSTILWSPRPLQAALTSASRTRGAQIRWPTTRARPAPSLARSTPPHLALRRRLGAAVPSEPVCLEGVEDVLKQHLDEAVLGPFLQREGEHKMTSTPSAKTMGRTGWIRERENMYDGSALPLRRPRWTAGPLEAPLTGTRTGS